MAKIKLPKTFTEKTWEWMGKPSEFEKYLGMQCMSYSQLTSFKSYSKDWIKRYCFKIDEEPGIFAQFGTAVGEAIETCGERIDQKWLNEDTLDHLGNFLYPTEAIYERPIGFVINVDGTDVLFYGFIDVYQEQIANLVDVCDIKTGSIEKKSAFYSGPDYKQTNLYAYSLDLEGKTINSCYVHLLDRKGNGMPKHPLRLTGLDKIIDTPYKRDNVEEYIENVMKPTIREISEFYSTYIKIFKNEN